MDKKLANRDKNTHKIGRIQGKLYRYGKHMENKNKPKPAGVPKDLKKKCFQCKSNILIKFVIPSKDYSLKNNWEYGTNPLADKPEFKQNKEARKNDKYICNKCLIELYNDKPRYGSTITSLKKKQRMKTYIYTGAIFLD